MLSALQSTFLLVLQSINVKFLQKPLPAFWVCAYTGVDFFSPFIFCHTHSSEHNLQTLISFLALPELFRSHFPPLLASEEFHSLQAAGSLFASAACACCSWES